MRTRAKESVNCYKQLGTLGGGNHFIEIDESDDGDMWLVVHTGSRRLGKTVCDYHTGFATDEAVSDQELNDMVSRAISGNSVVVPEKYYKTFRDMYVQRVKSTSAKQEISEKIKQLETVVTVKNSNRKALGFLHGKTADDYCKDMHICQIYAQLNRRLILHTINKRIALFKQSHAL